MRLTLPWCFSGSVLSGGGSVPSPQASAEAWASMVTEMQKGALSTRLGIPIIYGIDAVHGHNNVYKATIFPHNVGLGATRYKLHLLCYVFQYACNYVVTSICRSILLC
jgi:beta-glucosidase-like glycosyl hydrolase